MSDAIVENDGDKVFPKTLLTCFRRNSESEEESERDQSDAVCQGGRHRGIENPKRQQLILVPALGVFRAFKRFQGLFKGAVTDCHSAV